MIYRELQRELITETLLEGFDNGGLKLVLMNSDTWQYELPEKVKAHKQLVLDIKGWSLEQSYVDDKGVFIQTAFGDDENSKHFLFDEIINIVTFDGRLLYQKVMNLSEEKPKPPHKTDMKVKGKKMTEANIDEEKVQYSMKMMLENNKNLAKFNKGKKK